MLYKNSIVNSIPNFPNDKPLLSPKSWVLDQYWFYLMNHILWDMLSSKSILFLRIISNEIHQGEPTTVSFALKSATWASNNRMCSTNNVSDYHAAYVDLDRVLTHIIAYILYILTTNSPPTRMMTKSDDGQMVGRRSRARRDTSLLGDQMFFFTWPTLAFPPSV